MKQGIKNRWLERTLHLSEVTGLSDGKTINNRQSFAWRHPLGNFS
jgi:hypothetical protein